MQPLPFSLTNEAITVVIDGAPKVLRKGTAQFEAFKKLVTGALAEGREVDWDRVRQGLTPGGAAAAWLSAYGVSDTFSADDRGNLTYGGEALPREFADRANKMAAAGEDPAPLLRFFARLQQNPSKRSVDQLYTFLQHMSIPIEQDGTFLAYKGVDADLKDKRTHTIDNTPGNVISMPRNQVSDDPRADCREGLHVGDRSYAADFKGSTGKLLIVRVKPENVVSVPYDESARKMRVCEYEVVGYEGGEPLPSTTVKPEDVLPEDVDLDEEDAGNLVDDEVVNEGEAHNIRVSRKKGRSKPKAARSLARKTPKDLMKETIDSLRAYAGYLKIVGATKIEGGKAALIKVIVKARKNR